MNRNYPKSLFHFSQKQITKTYTLDPPNFFIFLSFFFNQLITVFSQQKTLGLTKNLTGSTADGYILFAPMGSKTTYLIDKCGKKINSWVSQYSQGISFCLLPKGNLT